MVGKHLAGSRCGAAPPFAALPRTKSVRWRNVHSVKLQSSVHARDKRRMVR
jgi:hypothetical protein